MPLPDAQLETPRVHVPPPVIAIASGKDGVGKSSIVVNLGLTLAKSARRVCVMDFDSGPGNVLFLLGLQARYKAEHLLHQRTLPEILLESHHGLRVLPAAGTLGQHGSYSPPQEQHLADQVSTLEEQFDCVLVDTATGGGAPPAFIAAADMILLVLTPDSACLADTSELVERLEQERRGQYHVLANRVTSQNEAWEVFNRFSSLVQDHSDARLRLLGFVPRDESLSAAAMLQRPVALFPDTDPSARTFHRLVDALDRALSRLPNHTARSHHAWMRRLRTLTARPAPSRTALAQGSDPRVVPDHRAVPENLAEALDRLRDRVEKTWHQDADAEIVGAWIDAIADAYWDHRGEPAIDLAHAVARLIAEAENDTLLVRLRELMENLNKPAPEPDSAVPLETLQANEKRRVAEEAPAREPSAGRAEPRAPAHTKNPPSRSSELLTSEEVSEIRRVWAMDSRELDQKWESAVPLTSDSRGHTGRVVRAHSVDVERFGPQEQIIDMLRQRVPSDEPLADWLSRFGAGNA